MSAMQDEYGSKKGEQVFYASKNKGTIGGVEKAKSAEKTIVKHLKRRMENA